MAWMQKQQILEWAEERVKIAVREKHRCKKPMHQAKEAQFWFTNTPQETTFETRKIMFAAVKEINQASIKILASNSEFTLWSGVSEPAFLQQQDLLVTDALNVARKLFDEASVDIDLLQTTDGLSSILGQDCAQLDYLFATVTLGFQGNLVVSHLLLWWLITCCLVWRCVTYPRLLKLDESFSKRKRQEEAQQHVAQNWAPRNETHFRAMLE